MKRILSIVLVICLLCPVSVWASDDKLEDMLAKAVQYMKVEDYESAEICYDIAMKLSPDGYYALILARNQAKPGLYIMDVQSLSFVELDVPEGVELTPILSGPTNRGGRLDWISNDKILIPGSDGNVVCTLEF